MRYPWETQPIQLYVSGHRANKSGNSGYIVSVEYGGDVRVVQGRHRAFALVNRFNRMQNFKWNKRRHT